MWMYRSRCIWETNGSFELGFDLDFKFETPCNTKMDLSPHTILLVHQSSHNAWISSCLCSLFFLNVSSHVCCFIFRLSLLVEFLFAIISLQLEGWASIHSVYLELLLMNELYQANIHCCYHITALKKSSIAERNIGNLCIHYYLSCHIAVIFLMLRCFFFSLPCLESNSYAKTFSRSVCKTPTLNFDWNSNLQDIAFIPNINHWGKDRVEVVMKKFVNNVLGVLMSQNMLTVASNW